MSAIYRILHNAIYGGGLWCLTRNHSGTINDNTIRILKGVAYSAIGTGLLYSTFRRQRKKTVNERNVILITGCDSGLGFNMALHCNLNLQMFVCATCLDTNSEGAQKLKAECDQKRLLLAKLDIQKIDSILHVQKTIENLLAKDHTLEFSHLVNNAGVMCFGEFEWQTNAIIEHQVNVNLIGTMNFTKSFLPLARKYKTRIINVTSHCACEALPGLTTYAATKAALRFWNDGLRVEMKKYGVEVVNFIPGSQFMKTNIVGNQGRYASEMLSAFTDEQRTFYGDYFDRYNYYLSQIPNNGLHVMSSDDELLNKFRDTILDGKPRALYKCEPFRYTIYHILFKWSPISLRDWLIVRFVNMPPYQVKK